MGSRNSWPPGFRFHPTDEELILYYLKRKINRKVLKLDIIAEIDVYKLEPEELPGLALLKNGDRQWFFFSPRDRKYPNGLRSNRSTKHGYWKATGKDRIITCNSRNVGIKKTLVFYRGRAPSGERTDWVMHEYTLDEDEFRRCQNAQDYYAIYKLFKKSGPGPKNGEQYGAPFIEEEWLDDDESPGSTSLCNHANHVPEVNTNVLAADSSREYQRHLSADDIDEVLNSIIAEPPPQRDNERPEIINNYANHVQEVKDNADASGNQQRHLSLDDIDEVMNRIIAEPPPQALDIYDFEQALSEFVGEEATQSQSTLDHVSSGEVIQPESAAYSLGIRHDGSEGNFNVSPTASGLQMWDVPQVASSNNLTGLSRDVAADDDFLEMDDLLGSDPVQVPNEAIPPYIGNNNLLLNPQLDQDGLNEFDLFYDADFNVDDLLSDYQAQPSTSYSDPHGGEVVDQPRNSGMELHSDSVNNGYGNEMWSYANTYMPSTSSLNQQHLPVPTRGVVYGGNSTNVPTEPNQNQPGKEGEEGCFSSTLWSFVESIPAAPASAAEATLVNKAFVRMSSFSRLRINPKTMNAANVSVPPAAAVGGTMRGLFMFSFLVMVFAVACVFLGSNIGVFGKAVRRVNL